MTDRELLQQAFHALSSDDITAQYRLAKVIRARLAQEPPCSTGSQCIGGKCLQCALPQREFIGLTDWEFSELHTAWRETADSLWDLYKAIEAKLKEKNV